MFVDIMRRKIFILSVTIYLFLFSCIHFKEHPSDPTTPRGYFLSSFLRNFTNNSIYQEAKGILDDSFGNGRGYVTQSISFDDDYGQTLVIQPYVKILLGGSCVNGLIDLDFCIARFNSDGTLDTTFETSGNVIQPSVSSSDNGQSLAIQPDGKILLGGVCDIGSNKEINDFCIARFNSDGTLDTTFGSSGKVIQNIGSFYGDLGYSLAIQPDGKILLGGNCDNGRNHDFCIARFNSNGTLDTTFGSIGEVIQPVGSAGDYGYSLAIQPDGKILLGGNCDDGDNINFCIARFNSNGTLDNSFGTGGKVIPHIGSFVNFGYSLAIQLDGKILLGGSCQGVSNLDFCIARFQ